MALALDFICITSNLPAMMCSWRTIRFTLCTYCPFVFILKQLKKKHQARDLKINVQKHSKGEMHCVMFVSLVAQNKEITVQYIAQFVFNSYPLFI